jgi:hypothetical protein
MPVGSETEIFLSDFFILRFLKERVNKLMSVISFSTCGSAISSIDLPLEYFTS